MGPHRSLRSHPFALALTLALAFPPASSFARLEDEPPPASASQTGSLEPSERPRYRLDPVVVTAERLPVYLGRVPSDVTVIPPERIERARPLLLADLLRDAPGIDVQRAGAVGKITDVRLRGADPRHTLVLFDGIPLNGPWLGSFDFADLGSVGIGQVEILGGPASSLYGSGGVGGVIQILSPSSWAGAPRDSSRNARLFAELGEDRTFRQGAVWSGAPGGGSPATASLSLGRLTSEGRLPRDAYSGLNAALHLEVPMTGDRLRVSALATDGRKELPYDFVFDPTDTTLSPFGSLEQIQDPNNHETDRVLAAGVRYGRDLRDWLSAEAELSGFSGSIENENEPNPGGTDYERTHLDNTRGIAALRVRGQPVPELSVLLGAEHRSERVSRLDDLSSGGFTSVTNVVEGVQSRALYAESHLEWRGRILLDSGIRLEDHSRFGTHRVPRVALGLRLFEAGVKLRGGYGRAFVAPTLTDLYFPGYGSPNLKPERSRTWEAGVDGAWLGGLIAAKATWHTTLFRDLIQSNSFFVADNVGRARIEGEEYWARVSPIRRFSASARAAHLIGTNLQNGQRLPKRPEWRAGLSLEGEPAPGLTALLDWWWTGSTRDPFVFIDAEGRVLDGDTPGRGVLDLGLNASLGRWLPAELRIRLLNALDRRYSEVKGFPARRRAASVGIDLHP